MDDKERLIDQILPALPPPRGFAQKVMRAARRPAGAPGPRRSRMVTAVAAGSALAVAAGVIALVAYRHPDRDGSGATGHLVAGDRMTVPLAGRAVAVVEAGAELGWSRSASELRVDQSHGEAFYRVDHGGPFFVETPAAEVQVTGTCFWVRVYPGRPRAEGRASSQPWVEVEVLEGSVLVRNGRGQVSLGAGGRVEAMAGQAPRPFPVRQSTSAVRDRTAEERAAALEARVSDLERVLKQNGAKARPSDPGEVAVAARVYDLSADDMRALARRCEIRYYLPRHLTALAPPRLDSSFPLTALEREAIARLMQEQRQSFVEELRALYIELTGERSAAETLTPKSLKEEIFAKATEDDLKEARRRIFQEWLGEVPPPRDLSTRPSVERFLRLLVDSGPSFHRAVSAVVGPERARQLRERTTSDYITDDTAVQGCEFSPPAARKRP